jgi:hypothetical protein
MPISPTSLSAVSPISAASPISRAQDAETTTRTAPSSSSAASHTRLSRLGDLMSKLQDLETSDPAKAKQVLTSIATALSDKATSSGDPHLTELADKFTEAAKTGDLSALQPHGPPPEAHGHGGPHGHPHGPPPSDGAAQAGSASDANRAARYADHANSPLGQLASIISTALSSVSA